MSKRTRERSAASQDEMAAGHRHGRLERIIREELDGLFRNEVTDPALDGLRVVSAELSVDYKNVRVRFFMPDDAMAPRSLKALDHAGGFLRARIGEALDLKRGLTMRFIYDHDASASARAAAIMDAGKPAPPPAEVAAEEAAAEHEEDDDLDEDDELEGGEVND